MKILNLSQFSEKRKIRLICIALLSLPCLLSATDTAFWKPYRPNGQTLFLEHFDAEGLPSGKFGGAHQGPAAFIQRRPTILSPAQIALEAWVRLEVLPEKRAYVVRRASANGTTMGWELFIEPNGAVGVATITSSGERMELKSDAGAVQSGEWVHLAGLAGETYALYRNGEEITPKGKTIPKKGPGDGTKETVAAPFTVADGLPGLVDEVRVQTNVHKFWPIPDQSWIERNAKQPLPSNTSVFVPGRAPVLSLPLDGDLSAPINLPGATAEGKGTYVDGVRGQAFRGPLNLQGALSSREEGTIEFWFRPVGINNYSDQNITLLNSSLFTFYLINEPKGHRPLTLYYPDEQKQLQFARDRLGSDIYAGKWNHCVITWGAGKVEWYLNGEQARSANANFSGKKLDSLGFNPNSLFGDIDELQIYSTALSPVEVSNTYWRYVDPAKIEKPRGYSAAFNWWYLPSSHEFYVDVQSKLASPSAAAPKVLIRDAKGAAVFEKDVAFSEEIQKIALPELPVGDYRISLIVGDDETDAQTLLLPAFPWQNNQLGMTDEVFPPFTPVKSDGTKASVVLRDYRVNAFGLFDSVVAKGREILAAPMRLVAVDTNDNELEWQGEVKSIETTPARATFAASSSSPAVAIEATSTIEMDGMMKVRLKIKPVEGAVPLKRLSIEIPMKESEAGLLHEATDIIRAAYAGYMPPGDGEIWSSKESLRTPAWLNAFTSYIWMGGPERGIAWFAENDKGWITAKNQDAPLMRILRKNGVVTLCIDLLNVPGIVEQPTELVFGLQASPTKPVPEDYRTKALVLSSVGLPVYPWGGLSCAWKSPWMDQWQVVDKVIEGRRGEKVDRAWFEKFQKDFNVPPVYGVHDWVEDATRFASKVTGPKSPDPVYFEEMLVLPFIPEYKAFQDEWSTQRLVEKSKASVEIYRAGRGREIGPNVPTNYASSYQDYALSYANEWMKRGVSLYWDNTFLKISTNPWTSDAYQTPDGKIQPATTLWNQRDYMRRTWNLMNEWRRKGVARPLEFVAHMTNQNLLPLFSWSTINFDIELLQREYSKNFPDTHPLGEPYPPDFLLTESTGLQVGAYPYLVHTIFKGQCNLPPEALGTAPAEIENGRREWGMRAVHEIVRGGPGYWELPEGTLDKSLYAFGYGEPDVDVWTYWADQRAFRIDNDQVKGLLLTRKSDQKMFLVLQSWSKTPTKASVAFQPDLIGFTPGRSIETALGGIPGKWNGGTFEAELPFPYETGIYLIDPQPRPADLLFADDFNRSFNPGWDHLNDYVKVKDGAVRFSKNTAPHQGAPRLLKWQSLPDFEQGELTFSFQIEKLPAKRAEVLTAELGKGISWAKEGVGRSKLIGQVKAELLADPVKGWVCRVSGKVDGNFRSLGEATFGTPDTAPHKVQLAVDASGEGTVTMDGAVVLEFQQSAPQPLSGFAITAPMNPADEIGALVIDDVSLSAPQTDASFLANERSTALTRSAALLAGLVDGLRNDIAAAFGAPRVAEIYNLSMFRKPEADVAQLNQLLVKEAEAPKQGLLLSVLRQLPVRMKEHVDSMKAIGQPAQRIEEFDRARSQALAFLTSQPELSKLPDFQRTADSLQPVAR